MLIAVGLALVVLLTLATGYFVAQEFAYVSVDRNRLRQLADEGDVAAARALDITGRLSFTLSGAQFGITVTALLVGYAGEPLIGVALADLLGFTDLAYAARLTIAVALVLIFSTVLQMVVGELAPKNLAIARPVPLARALSRSTVMYLAVAGPLIRLFDAASNRLLRAVGIEPVEELASGATAEDLEHVIDESRRGGALDVELSLLLERGLAFRALTAEQAMTPRVAVDTVAATARLDDVVELLRTSPHSRFPVVADDVDDVVGVVGLAELLEVPRESRAASPCRRCARRPSWCRARCPSRPSWSSCAPAAASSRSSSTSSAASTGCSAWRTSPRRSSATSSTRATRSHRTASRAGGHAYRLRPAAAGRGRVVDRHPPARRRGLRHGERPGPRPARAGGPAGDAVVVEEVVEPGDVDEPSPRTASRSAWTRSSATCRRSSPCCGTGRRPEDAS